MVHLADMDLGGQNIPQYISHDTTVYPTKLFRELLTDKEILLKSMNLESFRTDLRTHIQPSLLELAEENIQNIIPIEQQLAGGIESLGFQTTGNLHTYAIGERPFSLGRMVTNANSFVYLIHTKVKTCIIF